MTVRPGDAISASVSVNGQTVTVQLTNTTRGTAFTKQIAVATPDVTSAEWVAEAPSSCSNSGGCRPLPLANFGTVTFTNASATGNAHVGTISDPAWAATAVSLQGSPAYRSPHRGGRFGAPSPVADAIPAALSADGASFAVGWQAALR